MVAQLLGLSMMLLLVFPQGRHLLSGLALPALALFIIIFLGLAIFIVHRLVSKANSKTTSFTRQAAAVCLAIHPPHIDEDLHSSPRKSLAIPSKLQKKQDLIRQLHNVDWFQFEKIVALVYQKHGYTVSRRGGANPDGGIDLLIKKDGLTTAIQCKQWKKWNVGVKTVREFLGALTDAKLTDGILITLCGYSDDARQLASKHNIQILDERALANLLEHSDARFDPEVVALLEDERKICPKCEREMIQRTTKHGPNLGRKFWGCSGYPRCRFMLPVSSRCSAQ